MSKYDQHRMRTWKYNPANINRKREHDKEYNSKRSKISGEEKSTLPNITNEQFDNIIERLNKQGVGDLPDSSQDSAISEAFQSPSTPSDVTNYNFSGSSSSGDMEEMDVTSSGNAGGAQGGTAPASGVSQAAAAFSSSAGGGGGGGSMRGAAPLPDGVIQPRWSSHRTYKKQYHLKLTWDDIKYLRNEQNLRAYMQYPIFEIPWEYLGFYLTPDEIAELLSRYQQVKVINVKVKLSNYTAILNFDVGQAVATVGNNNVGFRASVMKNMRGTRAGFYSQNPADVIQNVFWGRHATSLAESTTLSNNLTGIGASFIARNYNLRFNHEFTPVSRGINNDFPYQYNVHMFNWFSYFKQRRNVSMNEGDWDMQEHFPNCIISSKNFLQQSTNILTNLDGTVDQFHSFFIENTNCMGLIKTRVDPAVQSSSIKNLHPNTSQLWPHRINLTDYGAFPQVDPDQGLNRIAGADVAPAYTPFAPNRYKYIRLDTNAYFKVNKPQKTMMMPSFAIALEPMMTSSPTENSFIQGWMQIVLDCECTVEILGAPSYHYPQGGSGAFPQQMVPPQNHTPVMQWRQQNTNANGNFQANNVYMTFDHIIPSEGHGVYRPSLVPLESTITTLMDVAPTNSLNPAGGTGISDYNIITRKRQKQIDEMETTETPPNTETDDSEIEIEPTQKKKNSVRKNLLHTLDKL